MLRYSRNTVADKEDTVTRRGSNMDKVLIEIRDMHKIYNPGEDELLALAQGALRVLKGEEEACIY